jgi:hypothetical protein
MHTRVWAAAELESRGKQIENNKENTTPSNITLGHAPSAISLPFSFCILLQNIRQNIV